jgi:hypothetical protein
MEIAPAAVDGTCLGRFNLWFYLAASAPMAVFAVSSVGECAETVLGITQCGLGPIAQKSVHYW